MLELHADLGPGAKADVSWAENYGLDGLTLEQIEAEFAVSGFENQKEWLISLVVAERAKLLKAARQV
jgi:hypothetical protein